MLKIIAIFSITLAIVLATPVVAFADGEQKCVTQYGEEQKCEVVTPKHPAPSVNAGLADLSPVVLSTILIGASAATYFTASLKARAKSSV